MMINVHVQNMRNERLNQNKMILDCPFDIKYLVEIIFLRFHLLASYKKIIIYVLCIVVRLRRS